MAKKKINHSQGGDKQRGNTKGLMPPWPKGHSGNPAGRPKKYETYTSILKELDSFAVPMDLLKGMERWIPKEWKGIPMTWEMAGMLRNKVKSLSMQSGDVMAKETWDRRDGRVPMRIAGPDGGPVKVQNFDLKKLSTEQLKQWMALQVAAAVDDEGEAR